MSSCFFMDNRFYQAEVYIIILSGVNIRLTRISSVGRVS